MKYLKASWTTFCMFFFICALEAQEGLDIDVDLDGPEWYETPWAYVALGVILVLAVLALRRKK